MGEVLPLGRHRIWRGIGGFFAARQGGRGGPATEAPSRRHRHNTRSWQLDRQPMAIGPEGVLERGSWYIDSIQSDGAKAWSSPIQSREGGISAWRVRACRHWIHFAFSASNTCEKLGLVSRVERAASNLRQMEPWAPQVRERRVSRLLAQGVRCLMVCPLTYRTDLPGKAGVVPLGGRGGLGGRNFGGRKHKVGKLEGRTDGQGVRDVSLGRVCRSIGRYFGSGRRGSRELLLSRCLDSPSAAGIFLG